MGGWWEEGKLIMGVKGRSMMRARERKVLSKKNLERKGVFGEMERIYVCAWRERKEER